MSKDVSITALTARARTWAASPLLTQAGICPLLEDLANALEAANRAIVWGDQKIGRLITQVEAAERDAQRAEDQANNLAGDVVQLEKQVAVLQAVTVPTENERYQGLVSAMLLLRQQEFHFPADSIASAIDELKRLRSLAAEVDMWSESVDDEDLMRLISEAENFSGEDRSQMIELIPRLVAAVKAGFRLPVPVEPEQRLEEWGTGGFPLEDQCNIFEAMNRAQAETNARISRNFGGDAGTIYRRTLGEWQPVSPDEITEGGTQ